ncbi:hypothetical protein A9Q99_15650 [Gammaproteobacteria bacterium 45_16_T64]|nr:hypothetical protein A9Q99_15650 [Gammaproteobacteria bacterium 45_16_T64]
MSRTYAHWVLKHRVLVTAITLLMIAAMASGLPRLRFSIDYEYFFGPDNPELQAYEKIKEAYTDTDNLVFIVTPTQGSDVFTQDVLLVVEKLTEQAWTLPYANRVDSITNFQHSYAGLDSDELIVEPLVDNAQRLDVATIQRVRQVALSEPSLLNFIQASDGSATSVFATFNLPNQSPQEIAELIGAAKVIINDLQQAHPEVTIRPIGLTMLSYTYGQASRQDIKQLTPLMFFFVLILVAVFTRSAWGTFLSMIIIIVTNIAAFGVFGWLNIPITTVTAVAPSIIMAIVIAHCVHFIETFMQQWQGQGQGQANKLSALTTSIEMNTMPIFITSLTTLIGFLSMNFNDVPPYRDLGNLVGIAVVIAFTLSLSLLPIFLSILPTRQRSIRQHQTWFGKFGLSVIQRRVPVMMISLLMVIGAIGLIPSNTLNEKFVEQFDERFEFRRDSDFFTDHISGIYSIEYSITAPGDTELKAVSPEALLQVDHFVQWLRDQPETRHVYSITDTFKRLNKNMHGDNSKWYKLPHDPQLAAQYLLLYEMSLPFGLDVNNQLTLNKDATRVQVRFDDLPSSELLLMEKKIAQWWKQQAPNYDVTGASTTMMFTHIVKRAVDSMVVGTLIAFGLISIVMVISLRSIKLGIISLLPNVIPIVLSLGAWALIDGEIGMSFAVVIVLTLGIIVDDTVHFLSKYQFARKRLHLNPTAALQQTFSTVGIALCITSAALVSGFFVLSLSGFARNSDMGLMAAITVGIALLVDLLLLPALLFTIDKTTHTSTLTTQTSTGTTSTNITGEIA